MINLTIIYYTGQKNYNGFRICWLLVGLNGVLGNQWTKLRDIAIARLGSRSARGSRFHHHAYHFPRLSVTTGLKFGIDHLPIYNDIKNASCPFLQFRIDAVFLFDLRRDTRSLRAVVSFTAVLDQDLHRILLSLG
jgi:hypothetical protein